MLVDDHPLFRMGLKVLLEKEEGFVVSAECNDPQEAWKLFQVQDFNLVICDLSFPDDSGISLVKNIKKAVPHCPILILSMHNEGFWAERVLQEGVNGYLMKDENIGMVIKAAHTVLRGEIYLSMTIQQKILRKMTQRKLDIVSLQVLSAREKEVFRCMTKEMSTSEIASSLYISIKTVQTHQANIKKKLKIQSIEDLRLLAVNYLNAIL